jgi:UDPglucose--hexose-1-phosphate uridylyltransferase
MGEIRQNKATNQWVIYAPARRRRPRDFQQHSGERPQLPAHEQDCPFCPGNEALLPPVVLELPGQGPEPWQTRVVPNKFPALTPEGDSRRLPRGMYITTPGYGRHEVIIESPRHGRQIATMSRAEVEGVIDTYHRRYLDLQQEEKNLMILLFRNHGPRAGTSLVHPHSQVIATGIVPHHIRWREAEAQRYFDDWGRCVYCDMLEDERQDGRRVLLEDDAFVAFIPFAAEVPCEMWIMPKRHQADFGSIAEVEKPALARALQVLLVRLHNKLSDPDYNYTLNTAARYKAGEPQVHWYLQIRPRLTTPAGFELGSGMSINPSLPEEDADFLREAPSTG